MNDLYKNKNVLIFGLGLNQGGVGSAKFFAKQGAKVRVTDLKTKEILQPSIDALKDFLEIEYTLGEHKEEDIDWADLIIKNPGVKPGNKYIEYAKSQGKRVEMDMGIFLEYVKPSQIIGVTGTKGKSTTASLVSVILEGVKRPIESFKKDSITSLRSFQNDIFSNVILAGNIGKSVLDVTPHVDTNTLIVLELSSFQLEAFEQHKVSPHWAIITNIYPDHLNYYKNMEEYIAAKKIIGKYQTPKDYLFINKDDSTLNNPEFLDGLQGDVTFYSSSNLPENFQSTLKGEHNKSNMAAALAVGKTFDIDQNLILKAVSSFKGVPFRMELIKEWNGIKIINDTTATGPDAGIQALKTMPNCILIAGGMNKNMPYEEYAKTVDELAKKVFFLEGDSTEEIKKQLSAISPQSSVKIMGTYDDLEKLLQDVKEVVQPGDTILFSPGATSFNLFQNEFDRGRKFNEAVEKIFT